MQVSHRHLPPLRTLGSLVLLGLVTACQDAPPTGPGLEPRLTLSEAGFDDGNPEFFFSPPLAPSPSPEDPEFDEGGANGSLVPYLRVCKTNGAQSANGCTLDVTEAATGSPTGLAMSFDADGQQYQVDWATHPLHPDFAYRIEIWGVPFATMDERAALLGLTFPDDYPIEALRGRPKWLLGWRDIAHSPEPLPCDASWEFCLIHYGETIPVKVRIERFVFCPAERNCAVQFVAEGVDANIEVILGPDEFASSVQLAIPGQIGTNFSLAFEPCTPAEKAAAESYTALPTFGPCLKTITPPSVGPIVLQSPATISYCVQLNEQSILAKLADPEQLDLVGVHHFNTGGVTDGPILNMEAWPHVAPACQQSTSGGAFASTESPQGFLQFAQAAGMRVLSLFGPEPLMALDLGGGGEGFKLGSFFMLALPAKFEYEVAGDANQRGVPGGPYTLRAKATDVNGDPVRGARVGWSVVSSPGGDASVATSPVLTGIDGISEATVMLSATGGDNVFRATGRGIADNRETGCTLLGGGSGAASCNGSRAVFDPFQPTGPASQGGIQIIPEGTRLPFTVFGGCGRGRGTPFAVDGTLAADEWDCASSTTFPVRLSGGPATATLYWMNDDTNFHIAVSIPGGSRHNGLRIDWDSDGDAPTALVDGATYFAAKEAGDDIWHFLPGFGAGDWFVDRVCSAFGQSWCGTPDVFVGGRSQTVAAFSNTRGGVTVYEMSHPLTTTDACTGGAWRGCRSPHAIDIRAAAGSDLGFFVTLGMGNAAQGNTQWPGFLKYMKVTIQ